MCRLNNNSTTTNNNINNYKWVLKWNNWSLKNGAEFSKTYSSTYNNNNNNKQKGFKMKQLKPEEWSRVLENFPFRRQRKLWLSWWPRYHHLGNFARRKKKKISNGFYSFQMKSFQKTKNLDCNFNIKLCWLCQWKMKSTRK
jgi:hypothetical protein